MYLSQNSYSQAAHERNILFGAKKKPTHSNWQLATLSEHFCAKLLSDYKEINPEFFSCTTTQYLVGQHLKIFGALHVGILLLMFIRTCVSALGVRNALRSIDSSIQDQFLRFLHVLHNPIV